MNFYLVDFYPKAVYAEKGLRDITVRVVAHDREQAMHAARAEVRLENPDLDLHEFEVEVTAPLKV